MNVATTRLAPGESEKSVARNLRSNPGADSTSVIVTTYNSPDTLRLVLLALALQTSRPDEVIVADDGSWDETGDALKDLAASLPFALSRVWQPDEGFRAARSRNNAVHRASGEILAFLDQDVLPHPDWLETHLRYAGEGRVGIGYVLDLPPQEAEGLPGEGFSPAVFEGLHDAAAMSRLDSLQRKYVFYAVMRRLGMPARAKPKLRSCNVSLTRRDHAAVNGFDEDYVGWGQEDDDLGRRLYQAGVRPVVLVNRALVAHLPHKQRHPRHWSDGANVERYRRADVPARAVHGLDAHPHPDVVVTRYSS